MNRGVERELYSVPVNGIHDSGSVVFEGIKEGVQGVSRLLAASFSTSTSVAPAPSPASSRRQPKSRPPSLSHTLNRKSHSAKESDSSISTYATSRSATTTRLSQSSQSSFGEEYNGIVEESQSAEAVLGQDEDEDDPNIQVLMVRDTGATPTMSPNPEFHHQQKHKQNQRLRNSHHSDVSVSPASTPSKLIGKVDGETWSSDVQSTTTTAHRRKSREAARLDFEHLDFSTLSPSVLLSPPSISRSSTSPASSPRPGGSPLPSYLEANKNSTASSRSNSAPSLGGLAPMSSIPGLGSMTAGVTVSTPHVGSWMDSVGKKLGQLQRSSTCVLFPSASSRHLTDP